jgi:uncharacterized membrane protein/DNA-directed RNA polymerase subunit RPC12/RpoP
MIHFGCSVCDKIVKVPESLAGKNVSCPRCDQPILVPIPEPEVDNPADTPGFFYSMSTKLRVAVTLVAVVGGLGLIASVLRPLLGIAGLDTTYGLVVAICSLLVLLTMFHGYGSGCRCCGAWWSRWKVKSKVGDGEVFDREGTTFGRSVTQTEFRCDRCSHTWSVTDSEEYPLPQQTKARRLPG